MSVVYSETTQCWAGMTWHTHIYTSLKHTGITTTDPGAHGWFLDHGSHNCPILMCVVLALSEFINNLSLHTRVNGKSTVCSHTGSQPQATWVGTRNPPYEEQEHVVNCALTISGTISIWQWFFQTNFPLNHHKLDTHWKPGVFRSPVIQGAFSRYSVV